MSSLKHMLEVSSAAKESYAAGYTVGRRETLLRVQSELHDIALKSPANDYESRYENLVVMLSEVDTVINKMLEQEGELI